MKRPTVRILALALALAFASSHALAAEQLLKPVPTPDLSKLSPETRAEVTDLRRLFEEAKANLLGDPLADAFAKLAAVYGRHGFFEPARIALDNAIALSPFDGRYHYLQGVFAQQSGNLPEARKHLARALELDQAYLPIRYRLADVQFKLNDFAAAKQTLGEVATKRTDLAPAPALLGEIAMKEKRHAEAIRYLEQALKADPKATSLHASLADAYAASGDAAKAKAARAKAGPGIAAFSDPLVEGVYTTAGAVDPATRALALAGQGKHAEARQMLDAMLAQDATNASALAAYARVEADAGNTTAARQRAEAALKADANGALPKLAQGIVSETAGQEAQAITYYEQAVRADLKLAEARLLLGNAYMRRQSYPAAAEQYRQVTVANPDDSQGYARLVAAEAMAGRCGNALTTIRSAIAQRAKDGLLNQLFVRLASSCSAATAADKTRALEIAKALYEQRPEPSYGEAYAMALAANGKGKEAVDQQAASMFELAKKNDQAAIARGRTMMDLFETGKTAPLPWIAGHPVYAPGRLVPSVKPMPKA